MDSYYPQGTANAVRFSGLLKKGEEILLAERMSSRTVKCASVMDGEELIGWQMVVPVKGRIELSVFGSSGLSKGDLEWIAEKTGALSKADSVRKRGQALNELYELYLPIAENAGRGSEIGFGAAAAGSDTGFSHWPSRFSSQFSELVRTLRDTGGIFRAVVGPAGEAEQFLCRKKTLQSFDLAGINAKEYIGCPVKARILLRLPAPPSVRLRTIFEEAVPGAKLRRIGTINAPETVGIWDRPLAGAPVLPDYAARIILLEPRLQESVIGIPVCEEKMKPVPASHKNTKEAGAVEIGSAIDATGVRRKITIGQTDLRRHYQIVGQTGAGKSTLLASMILSAIKKGHGVTFFDPHGTTIDMLLRSLPAEYEEKIRLVRIGDAENPVPLNIWDSDDPQKEERNISDLCELFSDIFDPDRQGYVGPRYERWLSTFAKASIALLGRRASLESIAVISQSQDNMNKACVILKDRYPELMEIVRQEYGTDKSNDFQNTLNWYLCKFQRLTAVEQLRKTLGAGANALDFIHSIDTDAVTLIDLAMPELGTHAARIMGTLLLMKFWNAAVARKERDRTHLVVVDEASLFQTNPMPRMLAESRKFGISMVLSHQHTGQLTSEIREALEANSANFSAFRLSPRDAVSAAIRFDDQKLPPSLTRLDAFNAVTTLSVDGRQTAPFTLMVKRPPRTSHAEETARRVTERSIKTLVRPYEHLRALTAREIQRILENPASAMPPPAAPVAKPPVSQPGWLKEYIKRREAAIC